MGIENPANIYYQLSPEELISQTIARGQGRLTDSGALAVNTGEFTGRSPKDKFIVKDEGTAKTVNWNDFNQPFEAAHFDKLFSKLTTYLKDKQVWVRDCYACADPAYRVNIRVITETPWANLFAYNMFLRPSEEEADHMDAEWTVIQAPGFFADPKTDGTRQHNFSLVNFAKR
ncbi:phosphoenolpyruvate carboxykinase (ATP) [Chitinophaga sedimenti]|uniref:phosphoenolpyruvate carboxykinase (ATP) n=1 Tax=Chitinophaga sedimenti TaxID=2033606 RepID=UPI00249F6D08|nr:phosphoenolpyruvate carboxykinase (ATP) [Chitinophaga sedimenti]